ncbi:serine/threonine protein kinase [Luteimonas sp. MC1895]|uniref:serine/threonine protein kinase n=1 Tax=Luteimonas sp. MC1895 TaxID=2819513 RepID=UPI0018F09CCE|nr:serine/threonine protein kinase [Luteimonas sp. MC1895]MBJ6980031.1 serine/threonine protein kinase [Luteimonas sp. MC1895]
MELDELRAAWQTLGRQLERHDDLQLRIHRNDRVQAARRGLRPLVWGQALQVAFGLALLLLGLACWTRNPHVPALLAAGVLLHAFGLLNIVLAAITIGLATRIDYGAPVLDIQRRMARLLRLYGINAKACGLPWWIMWVLVVVAVAGLQGLPAGAGTPGWITLSLGIGIAGLVATGLYAWLRRPAPVDPATPRCDGGDGIRRSQRILAELAEFERG